MLKILAAFALIFSSVCFELEAEELKLRKGEDNDIKIQVSQKFDQISDQDLESFDSGIAAVRRFENSRSRNKIPDSLIQLNDLFTNLSKQVRESEIPDNIDIFMLIDANGKTQTLTLMSFIAKIENAIRKNFSDFCLFYAIDSFVGEGGGAIPAAIGALGECKMEDCISVVQAMPSKLLYPESLYGCCGCFIGFKNFAKATASAYFSTPELINEDSSEFGSLYYDSFDPNRNFGKCLIKLFGANFISDLKSSFETISLIKSSSIIEIVSATIRNRDAEAQARFKRLGAVEVLSAAELALTTASEFDENEESANRMRSAMQTLSEFKILKNESNEKLHATISDLRDCIMNNMDIARDTILISLKADTYSGPVLIPSLSYNITSARNGKKILNINYRFAIPKWLYSESNKESDEYMSAIANCMKTIFEKETNISQATEMLVNFISTCHERVLAEL